MRQRHEVPLADLDPSQWFTVGAQVGGAVGPSAGGVVAIRAVDRSFDPDKFVVWSGSVYERAIAAWRDKYPELLRPVMAQQVWNHYAQFLLTVSSMALGRKLMASAEATSTLAGAGAGGNSHSVLISFAVTLAASQASLVEERARRWEERWLFERPATSRTHISGSVAVCPVCGGPADPADSGHCPYCQSDITTRTAGWLVTQVATTMHGAPRIGSKQGAVGATPLQPPRAAQGGL